MWRRSAGAALAALLLLAACGGDDDETSPTDAAPTTTAAPEDEPGEGAIPTPRPTTPGGPRPTPPPPSPGDATLDWQPCDDDEDRECATLEVPLDHAEPEGPTIALALARVPAGDPDERIGSLLINPGGPGASGIESLDTLSFSDAVLDRFDVTAWDPRGIGESTPLSCGDTVSAYFDTDFAPDSPAEEDQLQAAAQALADECGEDDAELLPHLATSDTVEDLEAIRAALGEDSISFVGFSYGTLIGQRYAEAHPEGLRALVLDGVVDPALPAIDASRAQALGVARAIDSMLASCGSDCPLGADPGGALAELFLRVETDPLPVEGGAPLGPNGVLIATVLATYESTIWPQFLQAVADAQEGDAEVLSLLFETYKSLAATPAMFGTNCLDEGAPETELDDLDEQVAALADIEVPIPDYARAFIGTGLPCAFWPVPAEGEAEAVTAPGAPPTLVLGNTGDNATPYEQAVAVAEALETGILLTLEGEGHTSIGRSPCIDDAVDAYLLDLELPAEGTVCR